MSLTTDFDEVYAVPGRDSIIDTINPATGLTTVFAKSEAQVIADDPGAVRMTWAAWRAAAIERQQTPITWRGTTRAKYWEMLEVLPPALWIGGAFLVGEPTDHCFKTGAPRFAAYWQRGSSEDFARYYVASRPLTCAELRAEIAGRR